MYIDHNYTMLYYYNYMYTILFFSNALWIELSAKLSVKPQIVRRVQAREVEHEAWTDSGLV